MHAQIRIGDSAVMLVDEMPDWGVLGPKALGGSPVTIHLYVEDVDAAFARAEAQERRSRCRSRTCSGAIDTARSRTPSATIGRSRRTRDLTPDEIQQAMKKMAS